MKLERLEARIGSDQKSTIARAAQATGRSLTDFVVSSAYDRAVAVLERHQSLTLDEEQSAAFVSCLIGDPKPGRRLKKGAEHYKASELTKS